MARSGASKEMTPVRPSATSQLQQFPGAPMSSCSNPSPPPHFYHGALASSSATPSTPPHFYPGASTCSSAKPSLSQWRPWYTPAPEGLLRFGRLPPMHPYNFQQPSMRYHETGDQMMENQHFAGTSPHDSFSTPPPPPHPKAASQSGPAKVNSKSSKRKRKIINIDADEEPSEMTAYRLSYTPEKHERLASAWLECSTDLIDGNGKKSEKFLADTSRMDDSAKAGWAKALKSMESTLFPEGDLGDSGE